MTATIPGYEINDCLYESDTTIIYRGLKTSDSQSVIIKILNRDNPSPEETGRFIREYEMTRKINLDGVIKIKALEKIRNTIAMVMEDTGGQSLDSLIPEKGMNHEQFLPLAISITDIIGSIHELEIMHKNINPSNIIWNQKNGNFRIIDFGIATSLASENPEVRSPGLMEGNLAYVSPEQTGRMNRTMDYRTDLYSLGVGFHEILTGSKPFIADDSMELVHCHIAKPPRPVSATNPEIPGVISDIILKLLSKKAEDRYQTAAGLKNDLQKCVDQLRLSGRISSFEIGMDDLSDRFHIPQKLYGREKELEVLLEHFDRAGKGAMEMILVKGFAGVGKTALVMEIQKPVVGKRGYFISGKFDQFMRDIPYSSLIQALKDLVRQVLTENADRIAYWKNRLIKALYPNGKLIAEVIPDIELITGPMPEVSGLLPSEYQNLFSMVFQKTVLTFASDNHPCVIFLDDIQWADLPSIKMIELLMTSNDASHILIICAFRNNEVSAADPFMQSVENLEKKGIGINSLHLGSLSRSKTNKLVAETLKCTEDAARSLSDLCFEKTRGNPFFLNQFLTTLHKDGLIEYQIARAALQDKKQESSWKWDIEKIKQMDITDNVIDLMVANIKKLPENAQRVLKLAACIGSKFELKTLSIVNEKSPADTIDEMWEPLRDGLIHPIDYIYKYLENTESPKITYKFMHNRVHQAAYSLIAKADKPELHLKIGRTLLKNMRTEGFDEKLFDIVNHLNIGSSLIKDESEIEKLAELNYTAGKKARLSASYEHALRYFKTGIQLLGKKIWEDNYKLSISLHTEGAEAAYLSTEFEEMDLLAEDTIKHAKDITQAIQIYEIKIQGFMARNMLRDALKTVYEILERLDVILPKKPNLFNSSIEFIRTRFALKNKTEEVLLEMPWMTDQLSGAVSRIGASAASALYIAGHNMAAFVLIMKIIRMILKKGKTIESPLWFAYYSMALAASGFYAKSSYFGKLAIKMAKKNNTPKIEARVRHAINSYTNHWSEHIKNTIPELLETMQISVDKGDLEFAALSAWVFAYHSFFCGSELGKLEQEMKTYSDEMARYKQKTVLNYNQMLRQVILNLMGGSKTPTLIQGRIYDEESMAGVHDEASDRFGSFFLCLSKMILCYIFENYDAALNEADNAKKYLRFVPGVYIFTVYYYYRALIRLAPLTTGSSSSQKNKTLKKVGFTLKKLKKWAETSPANYMHKYLIIAAESERVRGNNAEAGRLYEKAVNLANENGFIHEEAIASELMAKFYAGKNLQEMASACMARAHWCYTKWGAIAKARDLEKKHRKIIKEITDISDVISAVEDGGDTCKIPDLSKTLDLMSVMKASQAISGEIVLSKLLSSLLRIVMENAGAQRGFLLLSRNEELTVEARISVGEENKDEFKPYKAENTDDFSISIVNYCARTKKNLILTNAGSDDVFARDPYIIKNQTQSVLCMPLLQHGTILGVLYLENNHISGAFTPDRVEVLGILTAQAAISIQNATLYENLKNEITERTEAEEALKESEAKYKKILEEMEDAYCETDLSGKIVFVNASVCKVTGYSKEEFDNLDFRKITPDEDIPRLYEYYGGIFTTGNPGKPFHWQVIKKDGDKAIFETVATLIKDKKGNPIGFRGVGRDIAERIKAEENLRAAEEKYRTIFDNAVEGIFQSSLDGRLLAANHALARIFGYESVEDGFEYLKNFSTNIYVNLSDREEFIRQIKIFGRVRDFEFDAYNRDGGIITISVNAQAARDKDGNITHIDGITEDITERKRLSELKIAKEAAEASTRSKSEFLATMSHEIRTPLNAILGMAELLSESQLSAEQMDYVQTFKSSGELLLSVINDVLDFSKIEAGRIEIEAIPFDLDEQCENIMRILSLKAHDKGIALHLNMPEDIHPFRIGDPTRLRQILINLMGNAIKFTQNGSVTLEIFDYSSGEREAALSETLVFKVKDTGIGIPKDKLESVFDSFSQADSSTTRKFGGTGLGLSITKKLVEIMGGTISVESELGKGTDFIFSIPLPKTVSIKPGSQISQTDLFGTHVLVVDDNATNRLILKDYLSRWGARVNESKSGNEALNEIFKGRQDGSPYDLVLMDSEMPDMDGIQAAWEIMKLHHDSPPAIILLTSGVEAESKTAILEMGIAEYIPKPVNKAELLNSILAAIRSKQCLQNEKGNTADNFDIGYMRILCAEDIEANRKIVKAYLKTYPIEIDFADHGGYAVSKYKNGKYDIILMDMEMPEVDGFEAIRRIRKWERENGFAEVPIISLTAHAFSEHRQKCFDAGCTDFISKPFKKKELIQALFRFSQIIRQADCNTLINEIGLPSLENTKEKKEYARKKESYNARISNLFEDLIPSLFDEIRRETENMKKALNEGDYENLARLAHGLKGAAGNYELVELSGIFLDIERAFKQREMESVKELMENAHDYIEKVKIEYVDED